MVRYLPNLLATRHGRLVAFFFLYLTEGIPLGFAATAVATQLRRQGVGPAEIGAFVASFYLPWAFKWAFGPVIDVFASERLGRRRGWILGTQVLMACTLLSTVLLKLPEQLGLFTIVLLVHNSFGAMQDVAIDALAVNTLKEDERGLANGVMFAGGYLGQMLGGGGVLLLTGVTGFQSTFFFVAGLILLVTVFVVLPMREAAGAPRPVFAGSKAHAALLEMKTFAVDSFRSFLGTRGAFAGLGLALLPQGAMCLSLALQNNLAVELGLSDDRFGVLTIWSSVLTAGFCVLGGILSDRFGRRRMLALYTALMSLPVLYLMHKLQAAGWVMPHAGGAAPSAVPAGLLFAFWAASMAYAVFNGLMYGTRTAIFMDVTNPAVAATQFTAYMALMNLAIAIASAWQGVAVEAWGYPRTLLVDAIFGLTGILLMPLMKKRSDDATEDAAADTRASRRARSLALLLALMCLSWLPYAVWHDRLGAAQAIAGTFFTLTFVGSALFLLAGSAVLTSRRPGTLRLLRVASVLLLLMHLRYSLTSPAMAWVFASVAGFGAVLLLSLALRPWRELAQR